MTETRRQWGFLPALGALLEVLGPKSTRHLAGLTMLTLIGSLADLLLVATGIIFLTSIAGGPAAQLPIAIGELGPVAAAALFAGSTVAANLFRLVYLALSERYIAAANHKLTVEAQRRVFGQPYAYHVRHHSSELIASLQTIEVFAQNLIQQCLQTVSALATGVAVFWVLASLDFVPAIASFAVLGLLYVLVAGMAARRLTANSEALGSSYEDRIAKVQEALGAIRDLKIDHSEQAELDDFRTIDARFWAARSSTAFIVSAPRYMVEAGAVIVVAGLVAILTARNSGHSLAFIGGLALGGMRLLPLMQMAYRSWADSAANSDIATDIIGMLRLPIVDSEPDVGPLPFRNSVKLADVSFRYPERAEPVLQSISILIGRGERIAISGETGSGKSTLADLLMGLLHPDRGHIDVDGDALDAATVRSWQKNVAHVSQAIFLTDASISRNIAFSRPEEPIDMERVRRAAEEAEIRDFVDGLPEGFETRVGERGVRFSGGQRQRIGIARALYKGTPFLVLDEATNALDEEVEAKVLDNIFANKERTIVMIAHRPAAIARCDRVVTLRDGRIVG